MSISVNPYLIFDGNTKEVVHFYEKALGGKVMGIMTFGDMPEDPDHPLPEDMKDRVMHAHLKVGNTDHMFSDTHQGMNFQQGNMIQIAIHPENGTRAREIFEALEDGGEVLVPLQKTGWSPLYGQVKDKYGVSFQVNVQGESTQ